MPGRLQVMLVTMTTLIATLFVGWVMVFIRGSDPAELGYLVWLFIACWVLLFALFRLTKNIKIDVKQMVQWSGQRGPTLVIRGSTRGSRSYIPFELVEDVTPIMFEGPWWQTRVTGAPQEPESSGNRDKPSWWRTFLSLRNEDDPVPVSTTGLFGYEGPGLLITYRAATPVSSGREYRWKQQFPTRDPARLKLILESGL